MHHGKTDVGAGGVWPDYQLRPGRHQVVSTTVTPEGIGEDYELVGYQFIVCSDFTAATDNAVRCVRG